ncbi:hypothetical protein SDC9_212661 [bioreactor metagenome]|uniref:Uncharacterized protein n=1 Tax=bioreactor metagenome TaxID=1076179 RepID=A0A645K180_9ZZZZ
MDGRGRGITVLASGINGLLGATTSTGAFIEAGAEEAEAAEDAEAEAAATACPSDSFGDSFLGAAES